MRKRRQLTSGSNHAVSKSSQNKADFATILNAEREGTHGSLGGASCRVLGPLPRQFCPASNLTSGGGGMQDKLIRLITVNNNRGFNKETIHSPII